MGAIYFHTATLAKTPEEALKTLGDEDRHYNGHGPYSGSIGQKYGYRLVELPPRTNAKQLIKAFNVDDPDDAPERLRPIVERHWDTFDDKWSTAAICIPGSPTETREAKKRAGRTDRVKLFHFIGWAAS